MSRGGKHDFTKVTNPELRKEKKVMIRIPRRAMPTIKKLFIDHEIKGMQFLFDALIVSGICFRRAEILEFVREHVPRYKAESVQRNLAKFGKAEPLPKIDMYGCNMTMYHADHQALKHYVQEENIKQQWLWGILFEDGFAKEEKCIIDIIDRAKSLKLSSRKKAIARLSNDEYVVALPPNVAQGMLDQLTSEYDQRIFDPSIEAAIESKLQLTEKQKAEKEDDELEDDLSKKIASLRKHRAAEMTKLSKPDLEID